MKLETATQNTLADFSSLNEIKKELESAELLKTVKQVNDIEQYRITSTSHIETPDPVISIQGNTISTRGNLTFFVGQAKAGKSAVLNAIIASCLLEEESEIDTIGLTIAPNTDGKFILHIDTEQADHNHQKFIRAALKRGGLTIEPENFGSYNLRMIPTRERLKVIQTLLQEYSEKFNGVHLIIIDGAVDLVEDPNEAKESFAMVYELELLAIKYECPVVTVSHFNPSSTMKGRGHFDSQAQRKCESMIAISRNGDISTIEGRLLRNAGDFNPIEFSYSKELGYHTMLGMKETKEVKQQVKVKERLELIETVKGFFKMSGGKKTYSDLANDISDAYGLRETAGKNRVKNLITEGIIEYGDQTKKYLQLCVNLL